MAKNTIKVKKYSDVIEEIEAGGTITPGMVLELDGTGDVVAHNSSGENIVPLMVALEDELQGNDIDDNYSDGDKVQVWIPGRGDQVYAILKDGNNVSVGDFLDSNGDGKLKIHVPEASTGANSFTIYTNQIVGVAVEAVNASGADERIIVRIV